MMIHRQIEARLQRAVSAVLPEADPASVLVRPCLDPKHGDYQSNSLMAIARQRKLNPRQLAEGVVAKLELADLCANVESAGAGFINFHLRREVAAATVAAAGRGQHLFFTPASPAQTIVDRKSTR